MPLADQEILEGLVAGAAEADAEAVDGGGVELAGVLQVGAGGAAVVVLQAGAKEDLGQFADLEEALLLLLGSGLLDGEGLLGNRHAGLGGELGEDVEEATARGPHEEFDDVAGGAATEAIEEAFVGADVERRRLLGVKRAEPQQVSPLLFQLDRATNHRADVGTSFDLGDDLLWDHGDGIAALDDPFPGRSICRFTSDRRPQRPTSSQRFTATAWGPD